MRNNQPPATDLTDLIDRWQDDLRAERGERTVYRYAGALRSFSAWFEEVERQPLDLGHLTPIALVGYRSSLQKRQAATSTINTHLSALRSFCAWLHEKGHVEANPAGRLKLVGRAPLLSPKALTDPQVNALLRAAARTRHPTRDTAIVQLLLQTGIRIGEAAALRLGDIQFGEKRGVLVVRAGKGNKARNVPLNGSARQALADYLAPLPPFEVEPTLKAVAGAWPKPRHRDSQLPLWWSQKRQGTGQLSESAIGRMIDGIVKVCAVRSLVPDDTSAHTLRHTFATHYLEAHPGDLVGLAGLLGHSSLDTTRIYTQPTADELAERLERLDLNAYGG